MAFSYGHYWAYERERNASYSWAQARSAFGSVAISLDAQPAAFVVSGLDAGLLRGLVIDAQPATYVISGQDATLVVAGATAYSLDAQPAAYSIDCLPVIFLDSGGLWVEYSRQSTIWTQREAGADGLWVDY